MKLLLILSTLLHLSFFYSHAQQLPIINYTPREGVPAYGTNSIIQDKNGWIWLTSGYEVMRYDGHQFKKYLPSAASKMDYCFRVLTVGDEMWIVARPQLLRVAGDSLEGIDVGIYGQRLLDVIEYRGRNYFVCDNGLYVLDENRRLRPYLADETIRFSGWKPAIVFNDSLILGYQPGEKLLALNLNSRSVHAASLAVAGLLRSPGGTVYCLLRGAGIYRLDSLVLVGRGLDIRARMTIRLDDQDYRYFIMDAQGNFWVFKQNSSLVKISGDRSKQFYTEANGLPSLWIHQLYLDREKNLWIASYSGLSKIQYSEMERYTIRESLYSNIASFLTPGEIDGQVYIGSESGVNLFDGRGLRKIKLGDQPFRCDALLPVAGKQYFLKDSFLWEGSLDGNKTRMRNARVLGNVHGNGKQLAIDQQHNVYVASTGGLFMYSRGRFGRLMAGRRYFHNVFVDSQNLLCTGEFAGGLVCYKILHNGIKSGLEPGLPAASQEMISQIVSVRAITGDRQGNLFVGTRYGGLFVLRIQQNKILALEHFSEKDGLSSNNVWSLSVDPSGACWIGTAKGVNRIRLKDGRWILSDEGKSRQVHQATHVLAAHDNSVWVANHPGIVRIKDELRATIDSFSVFITGITVNGKLFSNDAGSKPAKLPYRKNNIHVQFSANTFRYEEAVQYSWRLRANDEWSVPTTGHAVNFSALRPGRYSFSVKAINANATWSRNEAVFSFVVTPPLWERGWFIALAVVTILGAIYALYRYRVKRIRELFAMRTAIASDLHDEIGSTLTSINILSNVSRNNVKNDPEKAFSLLSKVVDQSQMIQENMSDIVWSIRPDNDKMENMIMRMHDYLNHTLEPKNIRVELNADERVLNETLGMQQRKDFFLVFKEAINNIAKYAACTRVEIRLSMENGQIRLWIRDDGIGFDPAQGNASNGLRNMQHRAALLKGSVGIQSAPGKGTTIELVLPATQ